MKINLWKVPFDVDFHPSDNLVVTALINSDLRLQLEVHVHTDSCRVARFMDCGRVLLTASSDCSILATDVEIGSTMTRIDNVHEAGVKRLINLTESTVVSPDDVGFIKIWDIRKRSCYNYFNAYENHISDMTFALDAMKLLTTSEDGTLSICNLRTNTEDQNVRKFVCGSESGISLYSWRCFKDFSDAGLSIYMNNSIDATLKLDENRIITGSENGIINSVVIQPVTDSEYPVECLGNTESQSAAASADSADSDSASDSVPTFASAANNDKETSSASTSRMLPNISKRVINRKILMEAIYKAKTANKDKSASASVSVLASTLASALSLALVSSALTSALTSALVSSLASALISALTSTPTAPLAPGPASRMLQSINERRIDKCKRVINRRVLIEAIYKAKKANKDKETPSSSSEK